MKKNIKFIIGAVAISLSLGACTAPNVQKEEKPKQNIENFTYTDTSKALVKINEKEIDISNYVVNYKTGDIFINPDALDLIFDMKKTEIAEEEKIEFIKNETENDLKSEENNEFIKYSNGKDTLIMREGSKLYSMNGNYHLFDNAVIKNNEGKYSCSLLNIVLSMDFKSLGTSIIDDQIIYSIS